jgi:spermidine synthase
VDRVPLLYLNVTVVATCGLVYELLAGTLASYVLGDSVTQFSLIIGLYLSAMGVGAWLSGKLERKLAERFIDVELGVALIGGLSAPVLLLSFARLSWFPVVLYGLVLLIGILVGLELPLLMRICQDRMSFKDLVSRMLTFDYLGALFGSLMFPLFFVPKIGLLKTSMVFGLGNAAVGLWGTWLLADVIGGSVRLLRARALFVIGVLLFTLTQADRLEGLSEDDLFPDPVVLSKTSHYQRIVVTHSKRGYNLYLNGNLQFSSTDEYRYHEALVHPAFAAAPSPPRSVLVLGGGDGLAVREILRHDGVEQVTLVDLDPSMTALARDFRPLVELNRDSLRDPRVTIVNSDAFIWLDELHATAPGTRFDVVIIDFPDPNNFALGKLYTRLFYQKLRRALAPEGVAVVQSTSPLYARRSFWSIAHTMEAAGLAVRPYQVTVPSFGVWGYALARLTPFEPPRKAPPGLAFLNDAQMAAMFEFPVDMAERPDDALEVNRLDNQWLVRTYESEWRRWQ